MSSEHGDSRAPLRIGTLGAARITPMALCAPAKRVPEVEIVAVAARSPESARKFARRHGIGRVHESYAALIEDPEIDAVYVPLPNSHHGIWTMRALEAGKHVLCEKPIAANAEEARQMDAVAQSSGRILMEAFHWRYHPLAARLLEIVQSGCLGRIRHVEAAMCVPMLAPGNIRYRLDLAGGASMDVGAYSVNLVRTLAGAEPTVRSAEARLSSPGVDRAMRGELDFGDGRTGRVTHSLFSSKLVAISADVIGDDGRMHVFNPVAPHIYHHINVQDASGKRRERVARGESTYTHQLRAFAAAVASGKAPETDGTEAIANMEVIDALYRAAGLTPRKAARA
jgi:predicted dehydrogenase